VQAHTVHVHRVERAGVRIGTVLAPEEDDLRPIWGEVHGKVVTVVFRQADETPSIGHSDEVDAIAIGVGVVPAIRRHLLPVRRPGDIAEVQGRIAKRDRPKMGTVRADDTYRDPLAFRGGPRHRDLGAVGREAWVFPEIADAAYVSPVGSGREDSQLTVVLSFADEHDLAVKVRRLRRG
jgi:hypothetical protein